MGRYVAFLRGINVGGKNLIRMPDLVRCFEDLGLRDVTTYIQSGNVLFSSAGPRAGLSERIEAALTKRFTYSASLVLRSDRQLRDVARRAPEGFGAQPARCRYDVIFLKSPLTAAAALALVPRREGVDEAYAGPGVLYFSRLISQASRSQLSKIVTLPIYKQVTIRNWNTTTALLRLLASKTAR